MPSPGGKGHQTAETLAAKTFFNGNVSRRGDYHVPISRHPLDPAVAVQVREERRARLAPQMKPPLAPVKTGTAGLTARIGA